MVKILMMSIRISIHTFMPFLGVSVQVSVFSTTFNRMKSLRGKPQSIMFLGFNSLLSQQAAGN
jgi:hypothetical protein